MQPLAKRFQGIPDQTEQAVRLNGAVQLAAGTLLALGRFPRLSALVIAGTLVPTTAAGHRFWETEDKQDRAQQRTHFLKNLSMFGGLLIASADTGGKPSLAWRSRHAADSARRDAALAAKAAKAAGSAKAVKASAKAGKATGKVSGKAAKATGKARAKASRASNWMPTG